MKSIGLFLLLMSMIFLLAACGGGPSATEPAALTAVGPGATEAPATEQPVLTEEPELPDVEQPIPGDGDPAGGSALPGSLSLEEQLASIDAQLKQSLRASIAYNAPSEVYLNETVTIELLLNPSLTQEQLKEQVSEQGEVRSAEVEVTPLMKAELVSQDGAAFTIRPLHADPVQVVSGTETTNWSWYVTAQKGGSQTLTIFVYRLVKYDNEEYWREVDAYTADIAVQVTLMNQLQSFGWAWIALPLVALVTIAALWRRHGQRSRKPRLAGMSRQRGSVHENLQHIFLSYRRSDSADITGRIYDRLVSEFGRDLIFKDVDSIPLGIDFKEYLDRQVSECAVLLAVIGDRWVDALDDTGKKRLDDPDDFVRIEIESALEQGIPVIPLLVRGARMPAEEDLPPSLAKLVYKNGIPIRPDPDFHRDMDRLVAALAQYIVRE